MKASVGISRPFTGSARKMYRETLNKLHQQMRHLILKSGVMETAYAKIGEKINSVEDSLSLLQDLAAVEEEAWAAADKAYRAIKPSQWEYYDYAEITGQAEQVILDERLRELRNVFYNRMRAWLK